MPGQTVFNSARGGAPVGSSYVVVAADSILTAERVATAGKGLLLTDAGAGGALTWDPKTSWCSVSKAAVQSLAYNTESSLVFDTEAADTDAYHSNVTNNTRLTAPFDGVFTVRMQCDFAVAVGGIRFIVLRLDGTTYITAFNTQETTGAAGVGLMATRAIALTAGQYVEGRVYQARTSTAALDVTALGAMLFEGK